MNYTDFDELFWMSDPESMGRIIAEKYNLTHFYHCDCYQVLFDHVFGSKKQEKKYHSKAESIHLNQLEFNFE